MEQYEKVHLWIGTTHKPEDEYQRYFTIDYTTEGDFDDPNYIVCGFCQDIGERWYDEDFIGIIPRFGTVVELDEILAGSAVDAADFDDVKSVCSTLGIEKANAIFWYADAFLTIPVPHKDNYNGLHYIGLFNGD